MTIYNFLSAAVTMLFGLDGLVAIGAGIAVLAGAGAAIGIGIIVSKSNEAIARQPEEAGKIRMNMFIGLAFAVLPGLLGFVIGIILATQG